MYNILVCDDEKDIVSALHIYLSAEGYRVLTAFDGLEALRMVGLENNINDFAGSIPYGAQKRLELARALVMDPKLLMRLLPLIQELGGQQDSNARNLLYALRPYLKPERQEKVERALQLARLFHLGKKFLAGWEG